METELPHHSASAGLVHPILQSGQSLASVTDKISDVVLKRPIMKGWVFGLLVSFSLLMLLNLTVAYLLTVGVGIWGINIPVGWGFAIVNFVWWIGIGHAGTLISAILLLLRQQWRTSINRFAEAMTLFAVACAGMFPLLHMGRPWLFYWLMPYPNLDVAVAAVPQPAGLGRLRGIHLPHGLAAVLVRGSCCLTLQLCVIRPHTQFTKTLRRAWRSAGAAPPSTGRATRPPRCCSPASQRRWSSRCIPS